MRRHRPSGMAVQDVDVSPGIPNTKWIDRAKWIALHTGIDIRTPGQSERVALDIETCRRIIVAAYVVGQPIFVVVVLAGISFGPTTFFLEVVNMALLVLLCASPCRDLIVVNDLEAAPAVAENCSYGIGQT